LFSVLNLEWLIRCPFIVTGTFKLKAGLAQMAKGGIIMDVTTAEQARIAEEAGVRPLALGRNIQFHFLHTAGAANGSCQQNPKYCSKTSWKGL